MQRTLVVMLKEPRPGRVKTRLGRDIAGLDLPTLVVQEGGYAIEAIGDCLDAFLGGFR